MEQRIKSSEAYRAAKRVASQAAALMTDQSAMLARIGILETNDSSMQGSLSSVASSLGLLAGRMSAEESASATQAAQIASINANKLNRVLLPDWNVVIASNLTIALALGARTYTVAVPALYGVKAGDPIFVSPKAAVPAGYLVGAASAPADNSLQVQIMNPLIAIGGSASILLTVFTLRP